ncbi:tyrosine-type recombinase/integrase [Veronia pacifica]|uniref:Tyr recombinase domain-containing protein n=1 Tax=Veronia pacifica TaxID=1080227 RepID=A0A1C3E6K0_9GAMM|nr:site-specific integrase [Veronia pacifica]ODA28875.1 hypothetical protein A8L45_22935 [Veronia pacifica]
MNLNQRAFFASTIPLKISDAQIKKHMPDLRVRQLKDIRTSLYLRFNAERSGGTWWFYRYQDGKQHSYRIGTYPATQAKDVMALVSATTVNIAKGEVVSCNKFNTVDELITWHVKREFARGKSSRARLNNLKSMADKHLISIFHGQPLTTLDHDTFDNELVQPLFELGYSVSYVKALFSMVKTAFSMAKKLKQITSDPVRGIKFMDFFADNFSLTKAQVRGCRLNTDQLPDILLKTQQSPPAVRVLITMILAHGTRIGETRKAQWSNISFTQKTWRIPQTDTKNKSEMVYPLSPDMIELLRSYRDWQIALGYEGECVFPVSFKNDQPLYGSLASEWVKSVSGKAWSAHDLRKRARSIWQNIGVDYIVCELLLNHARDKLDQAYIHSHMELKKKEALEAYHLWLKSCCATCFEPVSIDR